MEIDYYLEKDDLVAFYCFHNLTSPTAIRNSEKLNYIVGYVTIIIASLFIAYFFAQSWGARAFWFLSVAIISILINKYMKLDKPTAANPLSVKLNKKIFQRHIDKRLKDDPALGMLGKHKLQITEQGFTVMTSVNSTFQAWAGVHSIQENDQYIFIYTTPISAHIIPKRAFNNPLEQHAFYHQLREFFTNSKGMQRWQPQENI